MKKIIISVIIILLVVLAALFLKEQQQNVENLAITKEYTKSVETIIAKQENINQKKEFLAEVLSSNSINISTKFISRIDKIFVNENDKIKKGDILISLDDREILSTLSSIKEQKNALEIDVANEKKVLLQNKKLYNKKSISKDTLDKLKVVYHAKLSALKSVEEKIVQTKIQLQYLHIKAPFSGRVGTKLLDVGSLALVGKTILTINSDKQKLNFMFSQNDKQIVKNQKVFLDNNEIGYISKIYDNAINTLLVAEVKLYKSLPYANQSYKTIEVQIDSIQACTVPINALLHKQYGTYIMLYKAEKFVPQKVDIILENSRKVAISTCPKEPIAIASEAKLSILPSFGKIIMNKAY